jgi:hypothetical protein
MLPLDHPDRKAVGGCGGAWWWHTPHDTLDKADAGILTDDTRIYLTMTLRMCMPEVIPYNFVPSAQDFIDRLTAYQEAAGQHLDLSDTIQAAESFKRAALRLAESPIGDVDRLNEGLKRLTRIVNPALFTIDGPYEFDPALQLPVLPGLAQMQDLAQMQPTTDEFEFLRTKLRRQRNRIEEALLSATALAREIVSAPG